MKILIVTDAWHPQVNGVVRTYEHLEAELTRMGHTVKVIGPCAFPITVPLPGYREIRLAVMPYGRLSRMIEEFAPDHIHAGTEGPLGWAARRYAMRRGLQFSTCYHTQFPQYAARRFGPPRSMIYRLVHDAALWAVRRFHAPSSAVMVATKSLEDELRGWNFTAPLRHVTRGVDTDLFSPGPRTLFSDLKKPVALYVGRVSIEKSIDEFLNMVWPGSKVVVGDGPLLASMRAAHPDVVFAGRRSGPDLAAHFRSADVFVFPSRTDTFGMVLIEALASGIPIAAHDVTGPRDIVTADFLGALDEDLSRAALRAMGAGDAETRAAHVRTHYTWQAAARQFIEAITL